MSVALDGYLKVLDYVDMKVTHSMRFPALLMSVVVSPDGATRVIGTSNGAIFAGKRKKKAEEEGRTGGFGEPERRVLRPSYYRFFQRGQGEKASEGEYVVARPKKVKVSEHDRLLRKFRHKEALVSVLGSKNPESVVAVIVELVARKKLLKCVENLEPGKELGMLLGFLGKYAAAPAYLGLLMGLARKVVETRAEEVRGSDELRSCVRNLKRAVEEEIRIQLALQEIQGVISPLLRLAGGR